jgi:glycosyltransferase involved in cell wall biosynthesis
MEKLTVSVIIPVYNGEAFLAEAMASIEGQNYDPLEIIIVDDGSTDGTAALAGRLGTDVRYLYQGNGGPASARNRGLEMASGEIIAFLDVDDIWPADKLEVQVACILKNPELDVVLGQIQVVGPKGAKEDDLSVDSGSPLVNVLLGSALFRRSAFEKVGVFDETLRYSEDHDWFIRAREEGIGMTDIDHVTLYYRLHGKNMTRDKNAGCFQLTRVLKKSLDRRREKRSPLRPLPGLPDLIKNKMPGQSDRRKDD